MDHDQEVRKILARRTSADTIRSRESKTVEFKQSFNRGDAAAYAKAMAAYANNSGGYIIFGIQDSPRKIIGLKNDDFETLKREVFADAVNSLFSPAIEWEMGTIVLTEEKKDDNGVVVAEQKKIGWIYAIESEMKPVIAQKDNNSENITAGDVFYRYRSKNGKIKPAEMERIIAERINRERKNLLRVLEVMRKSGTANLGIVNCSDGIFSTPYDVDVAFDKRLVAQALRKAKFIKEGGFNETEGIPVIKFTSNIDSAKEVPVPESNPDDTHPYIQKQMAEKLGISTQDLYALIWHFKMKESRKCHLGITVSKSGKIHKFSNFALEFLQEKLKELSGDEEWFERIRSAYKNRNKQEDKTNG